MTEGNISAGGTADDNQNGKKFADYYDEYVSNKLDGIKGGKTVKGTVVEVEKDIAILDIGFKSFGVVPLAEFKLADKTKNVQVGEEYDVYIVTLEDENNNLVISRERAFQKQVWADVEDKFKNGGIVTGEVVQKVKGGLQVDIGIPAFLPGSQVDVRPHKNLDQFIGETYDFKILKITRDKGNIVLSRRSVLNDQREQQREETLKVIAEGVVLEGTVKNLTDYGAFIDLGGLDGLLHITDISWGRINHPSEKLEVGQVVPVVVLKYDDEKQRVSLGMKQLSDDPWEKVVETFEVGRKIAGTVHSLTDYGAFVEIEEGVDGFIHSSDFSWTQKKSKNIGKLLSKGDQIEAVVLGVDEEQHRINLGIKQLSENPWEKLHEKYPIGNVIKGKVRSITKFGVFVAVDEEEGIDGLVHLSDFSWTKKYKDENDIKEDYKKGQEVEAQILEIDAKNERLSLSIKHLSDDPWQLVPQRYPIGSKVKGRVSSIVSFGIFVKLGDDDIDGLIHISELGLEIDKNASEEEVKQLVEQNFPIDQEVECEVIDVDSEERKISLSIRALTRKDEDEAMNFNEEVSPVTFGDLYDQKKREMQTDE